MQTTSYTILNDEVNSNPPIERIICLSISDFKPLLHLTDQPYIPYIH